MARDLARQMGIHPYNVPGVDSGAEVEGGRLTLVGGGVMNMSKGLVDIARTG